jgi:NADPH2:quinone reductase
MAKRYGAKVIATASRSKHEVVRALGADHVLDSHCQDLAAEVLNLTGGSGADLVLESSGGVTFNASLAAARPVTGRGVVFGLAGGEAAITNWDLVYRHQVHVIGLNLGALSQGAPQVFGHRRRRRQPRSPYGLRVSRRREGAHGFGKSRHDWQAESDRVGGTCESGLN